MDRLNTMTAFTKVVQLGSFTAAAADLGISRAVVSRYIADLESHVGTRLLYRTTRFVRPTELGQRYFEFCVKILGEIRAEEFGLTRRHKTVEGRISIACPKWVGNVDVPEAIVAFCAQNPKLVCDLSLIEISTHTHDFLERGYDVAILTRTTRDSRLKVKKLADIDYVVAASPRYLASHGRPLHPRDLRQHACLVQAADHSWAFRKGAESMSVKLEPHFSSNTYLVLQAAAVGGLGIALLPAKLARAQLDAGTLQPLLEDFRVEERTLYAAFAPGSAPQKVRSLLAFLSDWFRRHPFKPATGSGGVSAATTRR